ncbi:MAG TPA: VCBS repeat-containing protein [Vicinamibacterales bacterium]|jgi:hypothetical protein
MTVLLIVSAVLPASAATRRASRVRHIARVSVQREGRGSIIAVTYRSGPRLHIRFLHSATAIDRVALSDADYDGRQDILALPYDGRLQLWRNVGQGRFVLASLPGGIRLVAERGPRYLRYGSGDEASQWGDERYDAAMPRAPAAATVLPVALLTVSAPASAPLVSVPSRPGRAPPSLS